MPSHSHDYPTFTGTRVIVSFPKMSITCTATVEQVALLAQLVQHGGGCLQRRGST
jgi:hypothetical protein